MLISQEDYTNYWFGYMMALNCFNIMSWLDWYLNEIYDKNHNLIRYELYSSKKQNHFPTQL